MIVLNVLLFVGLNKSPLLKAINNIPAEKRQHRSVEMKKLRKNDKSDKHKQKISR